MDAINYGKYTMRITCEHTKDKTNREREREREKKQNVITKSKPERLSQIK